MHKYSETELHSRVKQLEDYLKQVLNLLTGSLSFTFKLNQFLEIPSHLSCFNHIIDCSKHSDFFDISLKFTEDNHVSVIKYEMKLNED